MVAAWVAGSVNVCRMRVGDINGKQARLVINEHQTCDQAEHGVNRQNRAAAWATTRCHVNGISRQRRSSRDGQASAMARIATATSHQRRTVYKQALSFRHRHRVNMGASKSQQHRSQHRRRRASARIRHRGKLEYHGSRCKHRCACAAALAWHRRHRGCAASAHVALTRRRGASP